MFDEDIVGDDSPPPVGFSEASSEDSESTLPFTVVLLSFNLLSFFSCCAAFCLARSLCMFRVTADMEIMDTSSYCSG